MSEPIDNPPTATPEPETTPGDATTTTDGTVTPSVVDSIQTELDGLKQKLITVQTTNADQVAELQQKLQDALNAAPATTGQMQALPPGQTPPTISPADAAKAVLNNAKNALLGFLATTKGDATAAAEKLSLIMAQLEPSVESQIAAQLAGDPNAASTLAFIAGELAVASADISLDFIDQERQQAINAIQSTIIAALETAVQIILGAVVKL